MYANIWNHLYYFSRFAFAATLLYVVLPWVIFQPRQVPSLTNYVSNWIKMVFTVIVIGYLLVILRLFEFIGLVIIFFILFTFFNRRETTNEEISTKVNAYIYDVADMVVSPIRDFKSQFVVKAHSGRNQGGVFQRRAKYFQIGLLILVLLYSAYLRFYDAYYYAAPAMSDGVVTLAWMKYIIQRKLFEGGIYPQGLYINMATIQKISYINPVYVLNYMGPFNSTLITFSIYFFISSVTKRRLPGIVGVIIYGILGEYLPLEWMRQAATNSQEFGFVFVFPVIYFALKYIESGKKQDLITYFLGVSTIGLIHAVSYAYAVVGIIILAVVAILINLRKNMIKVIKLAATGILSGVISIAPIGIGFLMNKSFHSSSAEYLTSRVDTIYYPTLKAMDYVGIASIIFLSMIILFLIRKREDSMLKEIFITCLGGISFIMYYYGGAVSQSLVVASRVSGLWALVIPVTVGVAIHFVMESLKSLKIRFFTESVLICATILICIFIVQPKPIVSYKMERNEEVEQLLRISKEFSPTTWMVISNADGAYSQALVLGTHMRIEDFIEVYKPQEKFLYYKLDADPLGEDSDNTAQHKIKIPNVFIYLDKKFFSTPFQSRQKEYADRKIYNEQLAYWLEEFIKEHPSWLENSMDVYTSCPKNTNGEDHNHICIYYEDENFKIYHINQLKTRDEIFNSIWK